MAIESRGYRALAFHPRRAPMTIRAGDYSHLAEDYAAHRAGYAPELASLILGWAAAERRCSIKGLEGVDLGAGTGIWSRQMAALGIHLVAVEPNDAMRAQGQAHPDSQGLRWVAASAESTGLPDRSCDVVTMASALHWTDFEKTMAEVQRILRPGGLFAALWNTREVTSDPLLREIERERERRFPGLNRASSGRSEFCESLLERMRAQPGFRGVTYIEGHHVEHQDVDRYLGLWRSANNLRAQVAAVEFSAFLDWIEQRLAKVDSIAAGYCTRVWVAHTDGPGPERDAP